VHPEIMGSPATHKLTPLEIYLFVPGA